MRERNLGILAIQETHLTDDLANQFNTLFGDKFALYHSPDPENRNARGIALILNKRFINTQGIITTTMIPGRAILMSLPWHNDAKINILAVYSPNSPQEIRDFWKSISEKTNSDPLLRPNIALGDFNLVEDPIDRILSRPDDPQATDNLREFRTKHDLVDGWRRANPDEKGYSWIRDSDGTQSRIDRIYINEELFDSCGEWKIEPAPIPTDHDLISARISTPTSPEIGRGRWAVPTRLIKNKTIKAEIQKLGTDLERRMRNLTPSNPTRENPQTLLRDFKVKAREMIRRHEKRIQPIIKMKITKLTEKQRLVTNDPSLGPDEIKIASTHIKREIQGLMKEAHRRNRNSLMAVDVAEGEKIGKTWSNRVKETKPRDTIKCLRNPADNTLTYNSQKMTQIAADYHNDIQSVGHNPHNIKNPAKLDAILSKLNSKLSNMSKEKLSE